MKMDTIFVNAENTKTSEPYVLIRKLTDKLDLGRGELVIKLLIKYQVLRKNFQSSTHKITKLMINRKHQKKDIYLQKHDNKLLMNQGQDNNTIMEYQKTTNLFDNASNQPSKFRTKDWVETNDESRGG